MKTVTSTTLLAALVFGALAPGALLAQELPSARLLDMYAVKEGDSYVVHVLANGDISEFASDRKSAGETYRLTLDVPALSPLETKYDVETPFSTRFQIWPMQLGGKVYSRIEIELDTEASSVVGLQNASHLVIRIQREAPVAPVAVAAEPDGVGDGPVPVPTAEAVAPVQAVATLEDEPLGAERDAPVDPALERGMVEAAAPPEPDPAPVETLDEGDEELFFSLFPKPAAEQQTLFNVAAEDILPEESVYGLRVGRFAVQPSVDFSYVHGDNLLLQSEGPFVDTGYLLRGGVSLSLLESIHDLKITYEGRYRDFEKFALEDRFTSFIDVSTRLEVSPRATASFENRYVRGAFESGEFDPGGEVVASTDPFYRNYTRGVLGVELSERLGVEMSGSFNRVDFLVPATDFFGYDTTELGGAFLYDLSPLTSLVGEYVRVGIPSSPERAATESSGDMFLFGMRGEITPLLRGQFRAGWASQRFVSALVPQDFTGFVADVDLTRDFGERAALTVRAGRRTSLSAFETNSYYVSSYGRFQFITPIGQRLRLTASGALFANDYPTAGLTGVERDDDIVSGSAGLAYFFTPLTYLSFDYRHDRRSSNMDEFYYRNNVIKIMVGFRFLNR